ncbi:MAG: hypothetical protein QXV32_06890 [Conexivisphaerales archaeon]
MQKGKSSKNVTGAILIIALLLPVLASTIAFTKAYTDPSSLNMLQVQIQPTNSTVDQFSLYIYNSTGHLVAQSSGSYSIYSFGLPAGKYLITASAGKTLWPTPLLYSGSAANMPSFAANSSSATSINSPAMIVYRAYEEYGYALINLNSSTSIVIKTATPTSIPVYKVDVSVSMPDGSPAVNADVYASPVAAGAWWYAVNQSEVKMWGQTDDSGHVTLVIPELPTLITAWLWVPIKLPENVSTVTVKIAGELINVSVYYQPQSVGFTGNSLIIPPVSSTSIVLHYQPQQYWVYAGSNAQSSIAIPGITQSSIMQQQGIPSSLYQSVQSSQPPSSLPSLETLPTGQQPQQQQFMQQNQYWVALLVAVLAVAAVGIALMMKRTK